ncbi:hypothetical protein [Cytobacillus firmus]|uniref:hypothetical protein n=1 Tax=Cytobacillus firmus TaxID=1399 RepID=UPI002FFE9473
MRVGTRVSFGHRKQETMELSPNLVQLRTQKAEKRRARVRTWRNFGHKKEKRGR